MHAIPRKGKKKDPFFLISFFVCSVFLCPCAIYHPVFVTSVAEREEPKKFSYLRIFLLILQPAICQAFSFAFPLSLSPSLRTSAFSRVNPASICLNRVVEMPVIRSRSTKKSFSFQEETTSLTGMKEKRIVVGGIMYFLSPYIVACFLHRCFFVPRGPSFPLQYLPFVRMVERALFQSLLSVGAWYTQAHTHKKYRISAIAQPHEIDGHVLFYSTTCNVHFPPSSKRPKTAEGKKLASWPVSKVTCLHRGGK